MSPLDGMGNGIKNPTGFDIDKSIPPLDGKIIIVTGGNAGIGKETILQLSKHNPQKIYLAARSKAKYDAAMEDVRSKVSDAKVDFLEMDLTSFASIKTAAEQVIADNDRLDILVNNAGIMGAPAGTTKEGYESHIGVNHMGHALFTRLLLPLLLKTAEQPNSDVRIVTVSSAGQMLAPSKGIIFENIKSDGKGTHPFVLYGTSKLANIIHARQIAKRYPQILAVSIHPGRVQTTLLDEYTKGGGFMARFQQVYDWAIGVLSVEKGAWSQIWAATWKREDVKNGAYYTPVGAEGKIVPKGMDDALADQLWDWQEKEFK
ncbi:NAD(P)-binding protein, partial [Microthyrium microscopicum]